MEVILKTDIEKLGSQDELVTVKPGYGRNFLIPKGFAILATPSIKKMHEETLKQRAHKEQKVLDEAAASAKKLKEMSVKVGAKVGEGGKIFGSVNALQLADALKKLGYSVDRKNIKIQNEPIKQVGSYQAEVKLHKSVTETITFEVVEE
ncbi:MAG: 50S ribosomal protein L9 [Flavobacteriales bacterium]|nr:50S ribosomal protein L9 [Flavobacteriales bacterium]